MLERSPGASAATRMRQSVASIRSRSTRAGVTTHAVLYREGGKQTSQTFAAKPDALRFKTLVELLGPQKALAELNPVAGVGLTVDQLAERFFAHKATDVTPRTLDDYKRDYGNWIKPALGHRQAAGVDEVDVQNLVDKMNQHPLDPKSVRDRHMILSSMFKWGSARTRRLVDHNPCGETELPKMRRKLIKGMTIPEWHAFYSTAAVSNPSVADMALFLVLTGWRWSEAAALTWANVADYGDEGMFVTVAQVVRRKPGEVGAIAADAKNDTSLRTSLLGGLAADMLRRRQVGQPLEGFVFTNPQGRRWHQGNFLARHWAPIAATVFTAERRPTPHWLRHTHIMLLDRAGATMPQMSRRAGHGDIRTTVNVYGRTIGDVPADVLERLDLILTPPTEVVGEIVRSGESADDPTP